MPKIQEEVLGLPYSPLRITFSALWARIQAKTLHARVAASIKTTNRLRLRLHQGWVETFLLTWMDLGSALLLMQLRKALKHLRLTPRPRLNSAEAEVCSRADLIRKSAGETVSKSIHGIRETKERGFLCDGCFGNPSPGPELLLPPSCCPIEQDWCCHPSFLSWCQAVALYNELQEELFILFFFISKQQCTVHYNIAKPAF